MSGFGDVVGVEPDGGMCVGYLRGWHGSLDGAENRLVSVLCLPSRWCLTVPLGALLRQIEAVGLGELVFGSGEEGRVAGPQSVYISAGTLAKNPGRGKRGGRAEAGKAPGPWLDLDVGGAGSGRFGGWDDVLQVVDWFDSAGIGPTMVIGSGSGGAHCYWHLDDGLDPGDVEVFGRRVRLWAERRSGLSLDRVENADRVLRLPGSVRWPKPSENGAGVTGLCTVVRPWSGARVSRAAMESVTQEVWTDWASRTQQIRDADVRKVRDALSGLVDLDLGGTAEEGWGRLWALAWAEDLYAESVSWDAILSPAGWTPHGDPDAEGRREWTRPGGGEHSARSLVTDWAGSPHVGSLLSLAPETGLLGLEAAGAPLTKARVAAELSWGGDLQGLLSSFLNERKRDQESS